VAIAGFSAAKGAFAVCLSAPEVGQVRGWARPPGGAHGHQTPTQFPLTEAYVLDKCLQLVDKGDQARTVPGGQVQ
jgi:hypothetical protein